MLLEPAETAPAAEEEPSTEETTSEESPKAEQSQEDNTLTVPITPQDEPLSSGELEVEGKKEEIPEKKDDGILVIPNQKEKKDDGTLVIPNQKKEKKEEDTGIYFDDSNSSESIELEDEYFELEAGMFGKPKCSKYPISLLNIGIHLRHIFDCFICYFAQFYFVPF